MDSSGWEMYKNGYVKDTTTDGEVERWKTGWIFDWLRLKKYKNDHVKDGKTNGEL